MRRGARRDADAPPADRRRAGVAATHAAGADDLIPFVHVPDVEGSIALYELLGFAVSDTYRTRDRLDWAALECGQAASCSRTRTRRSRSLRRLNGVLGYLYR
jgi:hypothetical protein